MRVDANNIVFAVIELPERVEYVAAPTVRVDMPRADTTIVLPWAVE